MKNPFFRPFPPCNNLNFELNVCKSFYWHLSCIKIFLYYIRATVLLDFISLFLTLCKMWSGLL